MTMVANPAAGMRVLCLDVEGGHGGSSRSLFHLIKSMDRDTVDLSVWCRRRGPILDKYAELGVKAVCEPTMPTLTAVQSLPGNFVLQARAWIAMARCEEFRKRLLVTVQQGVDVVHFNLETLWPLARWLRKRCGARFVFHVRKTPRPNAFTRRQARMVERCADDLVFITENEQQRFFELCGRPTRGHVVYNIAEPPAPACTPLPGIPDDGRLRVACLSNYSYDRGIDRLVDIAESLRGIGSTDVLFVVAGDMALSGSLPGALGRVGARGGSLADYATERGVIDYFCFLGHVSEPERVLVACAALAKPTRGDNPWGRDVLEALAAARPVASVGRYSRFVEDGVTGFLQPRFDAHGLAARLVESARDRGHLAALGAAGQERVAKLCGPDNARQLAEVWIRAGEIKLEQRR